LLWQPFWKWRPVEICWCQESFRDIIIYPHMKCRWNRTMLNLSGIVVAILKMGKIMMSRNDSWHRKFSIGRHFQNGRHNTAQIQHCLISKSRIDSRQRNCYPNADQYIKKTYICILVQCI
jgi:hypothetical protein